VIEREKFHFLGLFRIREKDLVKNIVTEIGLLLQG